MLSRVKAVMLCSVQCRKIMCWHTSSLALEFCFLVSVIDIVLAILFNYVVFWIGI